MGVLSPEDPVLTDFYGVNAALQRCIGQSVGGRRIPIPEYRNTTLARLGQGCDLRQTKRLAAQVAGAQGIPLLPLEKKDTPPFSP